MRSGIDRTNIDGVVPLSGESVFTQHGLRAVTAGAVASVVAMATDKTQQRLPECHLQTSGCRRHGTKTVRVYTEQDCINSVSNTT
ncbi:hypothetical protein JOB18_017282 [Solea senegalensis]|uniref:Uncharacterized protein n=1 Tax=Solea senegalensis TaxID=28829 RepID=A0AAV6RHR0_SOLSE|nr:hypothetical protein JOB18_017282 [Solea senegalensis]